MFRRLIYSLLIVAFVWVLVTRSPELLILLRTLVDANWELVALASVLQVIYLVGFITSFKVAFHTVEIHLNLRDLTPVILGSFFVEAVAPAGGLAGTALLVDDTTRRGNSAARSASGVIVQLIADFSSLTIILIAAMSYLFITARLQFWVVAGSAALALITVFLGAVIVMGLQRPDILRQFFNWLERILNQIAKPFRREPLIADHWAEKSTLESIEASRAISQHPSRLLLTIMIMLSTHLLAIGILELLSLAFDEPLAIGTLVIAYAIGLFTWIFSPLPLGTGVVEGTMSLVIVSLGVSLSVAIPVILTFRGLTFWLPFFLGSLALRKIKTFETAKIPLGENGNVQILALLVSWLGLVNLLTVLAPSAQDQLVVVGRISPFFVPYDFPIAATITGLALLVMGRGLWRHKRVVWVILITIVTILTITYLLSFKYEKAVLTGGLGVWLLALSKHFSIPSDIPSLKHGLRVTVALLTFTLVYGVIGFYLLSRPYESGFDFWIASNQTMVMFSQFYDPGFHEITQPGYYFAWSIYGLGAISLGYLLLMAMRPVQIWRPASRDDRERAREIVESFGKSSLAYLTLFEDKAYYFSSGGSVISYTVQGRVALTLGDPIGPKNDFLPAILEFKLFCRENDWVPAFCMAMSGELKNYKKAGFDSMCLGNEAVVDLTSFEITGNKSKSYRKRYNRLTREGYKVIIHQPPIAGDLLERLRDISDEWLIDTKGSEKRFFLGQFDHNYLRNSTIAVVYNPEGKPTAFTNIVPEYQINEITVDLMRRERNMASGTMDYLFVYLFFWARDQGFDTFNMGLCALSELCEGASLPIIDRGLNFIYEHGSWIYHFKGLYEFKDKFHPDWIPQFLLYPGIFSLPSIWLAMVIANAGGDDFPWKLFMQEPGAETSFDFAIEKGSVAANG